MSEKWIVTQGDFEWKEFTDEMVALSHAKDLVCFERERGREWHPEVEQYPVKVLKVVYESRRCDEQEPTYEQRKQGIVFLCDYQMFPVEEEEAVVLSSPPAFVDYAEIPHTRLERMMQEFCTAVAEKKEAASLEAILKFMPKDNVSALEVDEIRFYEEDTPCEDGFIRWRAKGPRVFGTVTLLDVEPYPWGED